MPLLSVFCSTRTEIVKLGVIISEPSDAVAMQDSVLEVEAVSSGLTAADSVNSPGSSASQPAGSHPTRQSSYGQYHARNVAVPPGQHAVLGNEPCACVHTCEDCLRVDAARRLLLQMPL